MPYKARQKQGEARNREKPGYRVTNAHAYNQSLKRRGMISLYFCGSELKARFINARTHTPGVSGREQTYTEPYIQLIYTFYRLFGWGMRQITGYMQDYWATRGLDIAVPSFGQLCERFAALEVKVTQRCARLARQLMRFTKNTATGGARWSRHRSRASSGESASVCRRRRRPRSTTRASSSPTSSTCGTPLAGAFASKMDSCVCNKSTHTYPNKAFYMDKTMMVFGDAKKVIEDMVKAVE